VIQDGRTWFVLVRGHGVEAGIIPTDAEVLPSPTYEEFVNYMRDEVESGDGLR
jgi:hypothetical protein